MAAECIFCGASPTSGEHVLGRAWIKHLAKQVRPELGAFEFSIVKGYRGKSRLEKTWMAGEPDYVVNCACERCNNGWMERLDTSAHDLLTPLALGESGRLGTLSEIATVSGWAAKVAACAISPYLDDDHSTALGFIRTRLLPAKGTRVWLGYSEVESPEVSMRPVQLRTKPLPFSGVEGYCATFKIHRLVFQVAYLPDPFDQRRESREDWGKYLVQLWPTDYRVVPFPSAATPPIDLIALGFLPTSFVTGEP